MSQDGRGARRFAILPALQRGRHRANPSRNVIRVTASPTRFDRVGRSPYTGHEPPPRPEVPEHGTHRPIR